MFARVIVEVAVVNRNLLGQVWVPMAAVAGLGYAVALFFGQSSTDEEGMDFSNPFELGPALSFGALYAVILLVSRVAQTEFGDGGVYVSSVLAGLTDVDAITMSMAELSQPGGEVEGGVASRAVTLAAMSNTVVKAGIVLSTGSPGLKKALVIFIDYYDEFGSPHCYPSAPSGDSPSTLLVPNVTGGGLLPPRAASTKLTTSSRTCFLSATTSCPYSALIGVDSVSPPRLR